MTLLVAAENFKRTERTYFPRPQHALTRAVGAYGHLDYCLCRLRIHSALEIYCGNPVPECTYILVVDRQMFVVAQ